MLITGFPAGPWETNCFVVAPAAGQECVIIDPGKDSMPSIEALLREHRLLPVAVILTHGHMDHTWSVLPVCQQHLVPAYIHPDDRYRLADPFLGVSGPMREAFLASTGGGLEVAEPDEVLALDDGAILDLAGIRLRVDHAPGHTEGSVSFTAPREDERPPVMFSGDLLFAGSIGRTDLAGGDMTAMVASLARVVLPMDDDTVVLPGHGSQTTIGAERATNPYLAQVAAQLAAGPADGVTSGDGPGGLQPPTRGM